MRFKDIGRGAVLVAALAMAAPGMASADVTVQDGSVVEGDSGVSFVFIDAEVKCPESVGGSCRYAFQTEDDTATGGQDYQGLPEPSVTDELSPGESATIGVGFTVWGDTEDEPNETFNVHVLEMHASDTLSRDTGVATILDDDRCGDGLVSGALAGLADGSDELHPLVAPLCMTVAGLGL